MSALSDPWPTAPVVMTGKGIDFLAGLSSVCRSAPSAVPTDDGEGGIGPPFLFVWHPDGEDEDHGVIMKVAANGRFEVTLTHGMADADLFHRLVGYCVVEGVPYEVSPCEPAPVGEGGA